MYTFVHLCIKFSLCCVEFPYTRGVHISTTNTFRKEIPESIFSTAKFIASPLPLAYVK